MIHKDSVWPKPSVYGTSDLSLDSNITLNQVHLGSLNANIFCEATVNIKNETLAPRSLSLGVSLPRDRSFPAQPISILRAQSRKKPTNLCTPRELLKKCLPRLRIIKSCYFDYRINKPSRMFSLRELRFVLFSLDLDVLRAQRIVGLLS